MQPKGTADSPLPYPSDASWRRLVVATSRNGQEEDLAAATVGLFPQTWKPQIFWNPDTSLPPNSYPPPLQVDQLDWLGDVDMAPGTARLSPGKIAWRMPCQDALVQILLETAVGKESKALEWLDGQGLLGGILFGTDWEGGSPSWDGGHTEEERLAHFLVASQGHQTTAWALAARAWDAHISHAVRDLAIVQQQAEGRRCRLVLRLADALSDHPDPDRFLDRLWTAAGEYGLVDIQWWAPRFEARRVVDIQGSRWDSPARPNAMEIDCAQAGSALQYADRLAEVVPGRARWRLCIPVNEGEKLSGGGVVSFTADRRFTLEESDAFEQCSSFLERALKNVDERIVSAQQAEKREAELKHSLEALVQEVDRTKRNVALQGALFRIARLASDHAHSQDFYTQVHEILASLVRVDSLAVLLLHEDDTKTDGIKPLDLVYLDNKNSDTLSELGSDPKNPNEKEDSLAAEHSRLSVALAHQVTTRRAPVLARDPRKGSAADSWLAAPLLDEGKAIGALCLRASKGHIHQPGDLDILSLCAQQVAHAISRQRAVALLEARVAERTVELKQQQIKSERQAMHDPLTDLPNRRHMEDHLELALANMPKDQSLVLMFMDLDHFKAVNDQYGHAAGDEVLIESSKRLALGLRPEDFVSRLSGDEFIVILQPAGDDNATQLMSERIIEAIVKPILIEDGTEVSVGCSIGWTRVESGSSLSPAILLSRADQAMYAAKRSGRGKAIAFDWNLRNKDSDTKEISENHPTKKASSLG